MIKIENTEVVGWKHAIRGMRNPHNSWDKMDSGLTCPHGEYKMGVELCSACVKEQCEDKPYYALGPNDHDLMMRLCNAGTDHRKFMRMIVVYADITAPLYWWKEFDTYKVGTVANSCSTMHKIHEKEFTLDDFSCEHLTDDYREVIFYFIHRINRAREQFVETKDKKYWWQMIQLLPSSYNQKRTVMLNYEVLSNIYKSRRNHKLDEWVEFCKTIETLPHSEFITGKGVAE